MRDFKQQLKAYGNELKNIRCPYSEAELDREIRNVAWNTPSSKITLTHTERRHWPAVAAAALIAAIIIPTTMYTGKSSTTGKIASVNVDGEHLYFACNNGCSPDATIETFKTMIR